MPARARARGERRKCGQWSAWDHPPVSEKFMGGTLTSPPHDSLTATNGRVMAMPSGLSFPDRRGTHNGKRPPLATARAPRVREALGVAARDTECLGRGLRFSASRQRRDVARDAALPCIEALAVFEARHATHDDCAARGETGELLAQRCERHAY